jgi:hypothetical protein
MDEREESALRRRQHIQRVAYRNERKGGTRLERQLWRMAKWAPYGGLAVQPHGEPLYLLRIYLTGEGQRLHMPTKLKQESDYDVGKGMRPYLHFFNRGDGDQDFHNHPWRTSFSLILTGGYKEFRWNPKTKKVDERIFRPGDLNLLRRQDFHRVELLDQERGCWTIFVSVDRLAKSDGTDWDFLNIETGVLTPWGIHVKRNEQGADSGAN